MRGFGLSFHYLLVKVRIFCYLLSSLVMDVCVVVVQKPSHALRKLRRKTFNFQTVIKEKNSTKSKNYVHT